MLRCDERKENKSFLEEHRLELTKLIYPVTYRIIGLEFLMIHIWIH